MDKILLRSVQIDNDQLIEIQVVATIIICANSEKILISEKTSRVTRNRLEIVGLLGDELKTENEKEKQIEIVESRGADRSQRGRDRRNRDARHDRWRSRRQQ